MLRRSFHVLWFFTFVWVAIISSNMLYPWFMNWWELQSESAKLHHQLSQSPGCAFIDEDVIGKAVYRSIEPDLRQKRRECDVFRVSVTKGGVRYRILANAQEMYELPNTKNVEGTSLESTVRERYRKRDTIELPIKLLAVGVKIGQELDRQYRPDLPVGLVLVLVPVVLLGALHYIVMPGRK